MLLLLSTSSHRHHQCLTLIDESPTPPNLGPFTFLKSFGFIVRSTILWVSSNTSLLPFPHPLPPFPCPRLCAPAAGGSASAGVGVPDQCPGWPLIAAGPCGEPATPEACRRSSSLWPCAGARLGLACRRAAACAVKRCGADCSGGADWSAAGLLGSQACPAGGLAGR
jgi:hypothetical protein